MSTVNPPSTPTPAKPAAPAEMSSDQKEIVIVSHSSLFYWWPVWAVGFLMFILTYLDGTRAALVPPDTVGLTAKDVGLGAPRDVLVLPQGANADDTVKLREDEGQLKPYVHMSRKQGYGVVFAFILLLVILITNVPMRGLWSVIVLITLTATVIIVSLAGWADDILGALSRLQIYINAGGYLTISLALLVIWLVVFLFFDRQIYMVFTPGQLRVRQEIGGGEAAYDTMGMVVQKQRNDLFRHWFLGLGSGDLIVNTSGAHSHHFDLPNVLFVGYKVRQIEDMLREKAVVRG